jgi:hypothetical protein
MRSVKNYVLASGRDRSGNPFCPLSKSSMGKKIVADSPVHCASRGSPPSFATTFAKASVVEKAAEGKPHYFFYHWHK